MSIERIAVKGPMTIYEAVQHKHLLLEALAGREELALDLAEVDELDTAGAQVLFLTWREAARLNKRVVLVRLSDAAREVLDLYRLPLLPGSGEAHGPAPACTDMDVRRSE